MELKKATRQQVKLRLGLSAVSGGGKTMSALLLAYGLCGDWDKIGLIDTENDSASLYSHIGDFNTLSLRPPFSPERYIEAIKTCENGGMEVVIIDSIAHEWEGEGGIIDLVDKIGGGFSGAWKSLTPRHEKFKQAILQSKCHIITTVRRKTEYVLQDKVNKNGQTVQAPVKTGLKEITREGWEYEVTLNLEIDINHRATASKDRTGLFMDQDPFVITPATGELIRQWCEQGIDPAVEAKKVQDEKEKQLKAGVAKATKELKACKNLPQLQVAFTSLPKEIALLVVAVKDEMKGKLKVEPKPEGQTPVNVL